MYDKADRSYGEVKVEIARLMVWKFSVKSTVEGSTTRVVTGTVKTFLRGSLRL